MADPRQMWENLQKGLARAQQSGQRLVYKKRVSERMGIKTESMTDLEAAEAVLHLLEEQ